MKAVLEAQHLGLRAMGEIKDAELVFSRTYWLLQQQDWIPPNFRP